MSAFLKLYEGLTREGPGESAQVSWACAQAGVPRDARILDAGCGSGADISALLAAAPEGHVTAVDKQAVFTQKAEDAFAADARVNIVTGDMMGQEGPFDFIWSAGALYFIGIEAALRSLRSDLGLKGAIAFSEICWFTPNPALEAKTFWSAYEAMTDEAGVSTHIATAGYEVIAQIRLPDTAWENYYQTLEARCDVLGLEADDEMLQVINETRVEMAIWRKHRAEFGYLLNVVRPI